MVKFDIIIRDLREAFSNYNFVKNVDGALYKYSTFDVLESSISVTVTMRDLSIICGYDDTIKQYYFTLVKGGLKTYDTAEDMVKQLKTYLYLNVIVIPDAKLVAEKAANVWGITTIYSGLRGHGDTGYKVVFKVLGSTDFVYIYQEDEDKTLYTASLVSQDGDASKIKTSEKFSVTGNLTIDTYVDALYRTYADSDDYEISRDTTNSFSVNGDISFRYLLEIRDGEYVAVVSEPVEIEIVGDYAYNMSAIEDAIKTLTSAQDDEIVAESDIDEVVYSDNNAEETVELDEFVEEVEPEQEVKEELELEDSIDKEDIVEVLPSSEELESTVIEPVAEEVEIYVENTEDCAEDKIELIEDSEVIDIHNDSAEIKEETLGYTNNNVNEELSVEKEEDICCILKVINDAGNIVKYEIVSEKAIYFIPLDIADNLGLVEQAVLKSDKIVVKNGLALTGMERLHKKFGKILGQADITEDILDMLF